MILKSLELQGFKTFPDKTTLSFERGITSVVGPNGSGKSNISDAMRWVLGEQSLRSLRCSKMEDVIFGGTPQRRALGFAEVTLTIDNADRALPFDNDQVAISRRYYRTGESEYLINKNTVRLRDINELFMDTGLGRDGYSIIGQGKIDSIVAARSEDRREIFEEAAGISRYRYRKEEAERRLGRAEENLVRLRDILSELEGRVGPLKEQAEKAEKFIEYDGEKKGLEIGIWLETLRRSAQGIREHRDKIDLAGAQHRQIERELEEIARRTEENLREVNGCTAAMDGARNEAASLDEQAVRAEGEVGLLEQEIAHNAQDILRLEGQIEAARQSREDTEKEIEDKRAQLSEQERRIEESRKKLQDFTLTLEELRKGADQATREIELAAAKLAGVNASLSEERVKISSAQSSMEEILRRAQAVEESVRQTAERQEAAEKEGRELSELLEGIETEIAAKENAVKGYQLRLESRRRKVQQNKDQVDKLTLDTNEQLRRAKLLEDLERSMEGFGQSVKAVMRESGRGMLKGICGPVTRIIKVPGEYAVAIETALGAAMQNIVVETEGDAKAAIGFLKQRDQGRATFLPLTTVKGRTIDRREMEDIPGFVGVASELCGCEERFEGIKASLLGRVAVAEDLDSAVSIAKRTGYRYRVVSLDGQVVNAGGSLTGGSRAKNSGLLSRAGEIERIRAKAADLREQTEKAAIALKESQQELSACEAELDAAQGELGTLQDERTKVTAELSAAGRELESIRQSAGELQKERASAGERLEALNSAQQESRERLEALEREAEDWQEKSRTLTGDRQEQLDRCDQIGETVQALRMEEFSARKDRDALTEALRELAARQDGSAGEQQRLLEEIGALEEKNGGLKEDIIRQKEQIESLRASARDKRAEVQEQAERRGALERESAELRSAERDALARRESAAGELARLQEREGNLQKEYDGLTNRLWEEYELTRREAEEVAAEIDDLQKAQRRLAELKNKIKALGAVNVGAVVEYKEVSERFDFLSKQVGDAEKSKKELLDLITQLTGAMQEQFIERFGKINENFGHIFRELFGGGAAELSFSDPENVLVSGIDIKVHPPGKIVTHIESLSGGEKALVAISIYFAIMRVNPPPFCVLDEIEAALDDVNVTRFAQYLRRMTGRSQFITITHRRGTMEGSDMLYGVTMQDQGISKLLALRTDEAAEYGS